MGLPKIDWRLLTDEERLQLLDQAWESFRELPESLPLPQSHRDELDRRQAAVDEGRMPMRPWAEVREEIRSKLRHDP